MNPVATTTKQDRFQGAVGFIKGALKNRKTAKADKHAAASLAEQACDNLAELLVNPRGDIQYTENLNSEQHILNAFKDLSSNLSKHTDASKTNRSAFVFNNENAIEAIYQLAHHSNSGRVKDKAKNLLEEIISKSVGPETNYFHFFRRYNTEVKAIVLNSDESSVDKQAAKYNAIADLLTKVAAKSGDFNKNLQKELNGIQNSFKDASGERIAHYVKKEVYEFLANPSRVIFKDNDNSDFSALRKRQSVIDNLKNALVSVYQSAVPKGYKKVESDVIDSALALVTAKGDPNSPKSQISEARTTFFKALNEPADKKQELARKIEDFSLAIDDCKADLKADVNTHIKHNLLADDAEIVLADGSLGALADIRADLDDGQEVELSPSNNLLTSLEAAKDDLLEEATEYSAEFSLKMEAFYNTLANINIVDDKGNSSQGLRDLIFGRAGSSDGEKTGLAAIMLDDYKQPEKVKSILRKPSLYINDSTRRNNLTGYAKRLVDDVIMPLYNGAETRVRNAEARLETLKQKKESNDVILSDILIDRDQITNEYVQYNGNPYIEDLYAKKPGGIPETGVAEDDRSNKRLALKAIGYEVQNGSDLGVAVDLIAKSTGLDATKLETVYSNALSRHNGDIYSFVNVDDRLDYDIKELNLDIQKNKSILNNDEDVIKSMVKTANDKMSEEAFTARQEVITSVLLNDGFQSQEVQNIADSFENYISLNNGKYDNNPFFDQLMQLCRNIVEKLQTALVK